MPKPRAKRTASRFRPACPPRAIVDLGFIPVRAKLIELAAFFDRVERYGAADDFRCAALREAATLLIDGRPERARRILERLSDPTIEPDAASTGKAALGAWQRPVTTAAAAKSSAQRGAKSAARGKSPQTKSKPKS